MTIKLLLHDRPGGIIQTTPQTRVGDVVAQLADGRIGAVPVIEDGQVVGILSERDVIHALRRDGAAILDWTVAQVMTQPPITVESSSSPLACLSLMTRRRIRHLPVVDDGKLIGFVSIGDLVKARIDLIEGEADALRAYISG